MAVERFSNFKGLLRGGLDRAPAAWWMGILAPAAVLIAVLVATPFAAHYSHIDDSICQLAAQDRPRAWIVRLGLLAYAGLTSGFALLVGRRLQSTWGKVATRCLLLHCAYVVLLMFISASPKISDGSVNTEGVWHIYIARGAMLFAWLAMLSVANHYRRLGNTVFYRGSISAMLFGFLMACLYISAVAVAVDGVLERVMLLLLVGWFVALSLMLRRSTVKISGIKPLLRAAA